MFIISSSYVTWSQKNPQGLISEKVYGSPVQSECTFKLQHFRVAGIKCVPDAI